jgi:signal transduction histidine kinase
MMPAMTLRVRLTLVHAAVFFAAVAILLSIPLLAAKSVQQAGSSGPSAVTHPAASLYREILSSSTGPTVIAVTAVLSVAFGWLIAGRLLRPLRAITATAVDISATNLSRRLRLGKRDDEFARLGQTLNELFARLEAAFASQRHFVANASHELRTPLTAERTVLQVALADPNASAATLRSACEKVLQLGDQQQRLIDALLTLASSERGLERRELADIGGIAAAVVRDRAETAGQREVRLDARLDTAPVTGDPALAESLIANLVDNGLRYNLPGGWVQVTTATAGGQALVSVRNSGPEVPPGQVDLLFEPFRRLGNSRTRRREGHGLGLAIVRAIATAHDAELTATARPGGGLDITVSFPRP